MSTPLPFMLYAIWGKIFGFELITLRFFSIVIASFFYCIAFIFLKSVFSPKKALLYTVFLSLNPYLLGLSYFVFTDMLSMLFIVITIWAINKNNFILMSIGIAGALLCRQYLIFMPITIIVAAAISFLYTHNKQDITKLISAVMGTFPLCLLVLYWGGLSPVNTTRQDYINESMKFHPEALSLYVLLITVYMFPVIIMKFKELYSSLKVVLWSIPFSLFILLFPVMQPVSWIEKEHHIVGFFHKITALSGTILVEKLIFYVCFLFAIPVLLKIVSDLINNIRNRQFDLFFMAQIAVFSFMMIMPLSYMLWEKYFIPVILFLIICLEKKKDQKITVF
jgi:4-amino-4-deoxy-L-arabinose transferase-like glycosyltransferase